jgi:hypothetical protein
MNAVEISERAQLDGEARNLAAENLPARTYIELLAQRERLRDSICALAQAFPPIDAITWGVSSIRRVGAALAKPNAEPTLQSIEKWLADPTEEGRRAALAAAEQAGISTPAGCLAFAVFLSGGSMAPPDAPVSPEPPPHVSGRMVAGAISLAIALEPRNASELRRGFLTQGLQWATERKIWEEKGK